MRTYLHRCSNRLSRISDLQNELQIAVNQPLKTGNAVRWHSTHNSMKWSPSQSVLFKPMILTLEQRPDTKMALMRTVICTTVTGR